MMVMVIMLSLIWYRAGRQDKEATSSLPPSNAVVGDL